MPIIKFQMIDSEKNAPIFEIEVPEGTSILEAAKQCGLPLEHACEGYCACATCHVIVLEGMDSLDPASAREEDMLDCAWDATLGSRLSCQAKIAKQDLRVLIPKYSLNPAKMVQRFPFIWDPTKIVSSGENKSSNCKGCCCSKSIDNGSEMHQPLTWDDAEEIAHRLHDQNPTIDPSLLRFTELHQKICDLKHFKGDSTASNESKLERILQEWLDLKE